MPRVYTRDHEPELCTYEIKFYKYHMYMYMRASQADAKYSMRASQAGTKYSMRASQTGVKYFMRASQDGNKY